jgi:hypothetical protein
VKHGLISPDIASLILMLMIPPLPLPEGRSRLMNHARHGNCRIPNNRVAFPYYGVFDTPLSLSSAQILATGIPARRDHQTRAKLARLY